MRIGDWIQTYSGIQMYPLDPKENEIHIEDIAHALSMLCRFNGHTSEFYSVAEHCCHVHDILPHELKLTGLLHDASEAYLCDMPRPIKRSPGFASEYLAAESRLMMVIAKKFDLQWPMHERVEQADNAVLATEARRLMAPLHPEWKDHYGAADIDLPLWSPIQARDEFLRRYAYWREV